MTTPPRLTLLIILGLFAAWTTMLAAAPTPPPDNVFPWNVGWGATSPGAMNASDLLDKPAGKHGPIIARDGHFYTGERRIRFWGVNTCFSANFPTHDQADVVAKRLAAFGFNVVRFHHMDSSTWPSGLMKDDKSGDLHPEALDRLDYFIAALKREGIYANINLHVGRRWTKVLGTPNADKVPYGDKIVDLFDAKLIDAEKAYARALLDRVNAYTKLRYADEPAVAAVEINNENTFFYWGGENQLAQLTEPYASDLQKLWNAWLVTRYGSREKLAVAWGGDVAGAKVDATNLLRETDFAQLGKGKSAWMVENHAPAEMSATSEGNGVRVEIKKVDGTGWHLQLNQPGLKIKAGQFYTLAFKASADKPVTITAGASMAHAPWGNLGLQRELKLTPELQDLRLGFTASKDDDNARVSFALGDGVATIRLSDLTLREGGREGLRHGEDPAAATVARSGAGALDTPERLNDWYRFLQETDQTYFVSMRTFLKDELGVKAPITGTIGLGPMGTMSQAQMDFVDAHTYWDHPTFPGGRWSTTHWQMKNKPMSDDSAYASLWTLASTRVAGKPFTVTEFNIASPNEHEAEAVPMIAALAAAQDWDAVYLFAYAHDSQYDNGRMSGFFDIEGNPLKMAHLPIAARIFHRTAPSPGSLSVSITWAEILPKASAYYYEQWGFLRDVKGVKGSDVLARKLAVRFDGAGGAPAAQGEADPRLRWTGQGAGSQTGQFAFADETGVAFAGFVASGTSVDLGLIKIEATRTPYLTLTVAPADAGQTIETADRLLLAVAARAGNTGMVWDEARKTVNDRWGKAPVLVEQVDADISIRGKPVKVYALGENGERIGEVAVEAKDGRSVIKLGTAKSLWFEMVREK